MSIDEHYLVKTFGKTSSEIGEEARKVGKDKFALNLNQYWGDVGYLYNTPNFLKNPSRFTEFQISEHKKHLELSKKKLNSEDSLHHRLVTADLDLERSLQFLSGGESEFAYGLGVMLTYLSLVPKAILNLTTPSKMFKTEYDKINKQNIYYFLDLQLMKKGLDFVDSQIPYSCGFLDDSVTENLITWRKIQDELVFVHTRLFNTSVKCIDTFKKYFKIVFPNESLDP